MGGMFVLPALLAASAVHPPLSYHFEVMRASGVIYNPWTLSDDRVELRSFVGSGAKPGDFVAPTIRVAPGQQLDIAIDNKLEPCTDKQHADHVCFSDTNLHTHGLWISPSGHSDNVLISIAPGSSFQYSYEIPADHPAGTYWYHPHQHGAGYVQVGSGMAGALDRHRQSPADGNHAGGRRYFAEGSGRPGISRSGDAVPADRLWLFRQSGSDRRRAYQRRQPRPPICLFRR